MTVRQAQLVANDPQALAYDELEALEVLEDLLAANGRMMTTGQRRTAERLIQKLRQAVTEDLGGI